MKDGSFDKRRRLGGGGCSLQPSSTLLKIQLRFGKEEKNLLAVVCW